MDILLAIIKSFLVVGGVLALCWILNLVWYFIKGNTK